MNNVGESVRAFKSRITRDVKTQDTDEDEESAETSGSPSERWRIGSETRTRGSIHTDFFRTTAASMSDCRFVAVYPGTGWWKERPQFGMDVHNARFSLIVTLEILNDVTVDLYSEIKSIIDAKIKIKNGIKVETFVE